MLPFPMFRSRSVDLALARQLIRLASLSPTSSTAFRAPRSPLRQRFSPTSCCSLTEQKESKTRATNSFVLKMKEGPTPATRFDSYTCKFKGGGIFSTPLFLLQPSPVPHLGPGPISATISRPWPLRAFQCPVDAAQEAGFEVS